jgi:hypothetical protein
MSDADAFRSNIDLPASPYTVMAFGAGDGRVVTHHATMSVDEAAQLLIARLEDFDWQTLEPQNGVVHLPLGYEEMLDLVSLVAEINLYQSRLLWTLKAPRRTGLPRMLAPSDEATELRYLKNLAAQRVLFDDALAWHLLEQGAFMSEWAEMRRCLVAAV